MTLRRAIIAIAMAAVGAAAHAHAFLEHAQPRVGSSLAAAPAEVRLWFTERLEPAFSSLTVLDANGQRVAGGQPPVDPRDPTVLRTALGKLGPGEYTVVWRAVSVDTHVTEGRFTFRIAP